MKYQHVFPINGKNVDHEVLQGVPRAVDLMAAVLVDYYWDDVEHTIIEQNAWGCEADVAIDYMSNKLRLLGCHSHGVFYWTLPICEAINARLEPLLENLSALYQEFQEDEEAGRTVVHAADMQGPSDRMDFSDWLLANGRR